MKIKKITAILLMSYVCAIAFFAQTIFERERILTEQTMEHFIEDYLDLFTDLKEQNIGRLLKFKRKSIREIFSETEKIHPSKKIQRIFIRYGLDGKKGLQQILVLQYGILACTIEQTLSSIQKYPRNTALQKSDREAAAWLSEIKAQINSADYALIKKYEAKLYKIFNRLEQKV